MRPDHFRRLSPRQVSEITIARLDGTPPQVIYQTGELIEAPNWSPDGTWLIYNGDGRLWRLSADGRIGPERIDTAPVENLNNDHVIAPDGAHIYFSARDGHLYRIPFAGGAPRRLSNRHEPERDFRHYLHGVSPDGRLLCYIGIEQSEGGARLQRIFTLPAQGGADRVLTDGAGPVDGAEFSPDGGWIWFNAEAPERAPGHAQIYRMKTDGTGIEQITEGPRVNWFAHPSPDGAAVAYLSFPPGTEGHPTDKQVIVRVMAPDGSGQRDIDSFNGGQGSLNVPSWAPDSAAFAYVRYPIR